MVAELAGYRYLVSLPCWIFHQQDDCLLHCLTTGRKFCLLVPSIEKPIHATLEVHSFYQSHNPALWLFNAVSSVYPAASVLFRIPNFVKGFKCQQRYALKKSVSFLTHGDVPTLLYPPRSQCQIETLNSRRYIVIHDTSNVRAQRLKLLW